MQPRSLIKDLTFFPMLTTWAALTLLMIAPSTSELNILIEKFKPNAVVRPALHDGHSRQQILRFPDLNNANSIGNPSGPGFKPQLSVSYARFAFNRCINLNSEALCHFDCCSDSWPDYRLRLRGGGKTPNKKRPYSEYFPEQDASMPRNGTESNNPESSKPNAIIYKPGGSAFGKVEVVEQENINSFLEESCIPGRCYQPILEINLTEMRAETMPQTSTPSHDGERFDWYGSIRVCFEDSARETPELFLSVGGNRRQERRS
jgi:hypothetical protein